MENLMATKVVYFRDILTFELGFELVFPGGFSSYRQVSQAWFRRRTFHVPNLTEEVRLWSDTGATSDSDGVPCDKRKLSSTKVRQTLSNLTLLPQTKTAVPN